MQHISIFFKKKLYVAAANQHKLEGINEKKNEKKKY